MLDCGIDKLIGKTLSKIERGDDKLIFTTTTGEIYNMYHDQDCCENVSIEDIIGNLDDLIGDPVLRASDDTNSDAMPTDYAYESYTWTFYTIRTIKATVTIRWFGTSNGYYSESVTFSQV